MTNFIPSGRYWITTSDMTFTLSDGTKIIVPKGFETDGHTMPPVLSIFLNPYSYDMYAALLHDWLYENRIGTRKRADREYLRFMQQLGTNRIRRYSFYFMVRLFGWIWWHL